MTNIEKVMQAAARTKIGMNTILNAQDEIDAMRAEIARLHKIEDAARAVVELAAADNIRYAALNDALEVNDIK